MCVCTKKSTTISYSKAQPNEMVIGNNQYQSTKDRFDDDYLIVEIYPIRSETIKLAVSDNFKCNANSFYIKS